MGVEAVIIFEGSTTCGVNLEARPLSVRGRSRSSKGGRF